MPRLTRAGTPHAGYKSRRPAGPGPDHETGLDLEALAGNTVVGSEYEYNDANQLTLRRNLTSSPTNFVIPFILIGSFRMWLCAGCTGTSA